jgi:predicted MFS family arabinose efflux permease
MWVCIPIRKIILFARFMLKKLTHIYRDAYSGHPKEIWVLAALTLINRMGTMVLPFLSVYLSTVRGFSLQDAGWIGGAFGLGSFSGSYLGGKISDRIGAEKVIVISMLFSGIMFVTIQWAETFWQFWILVFITALFGESYRPALMVSVAKFVPKNQMGRTMSLIRLAINMGLSFSPMAAGLLISTVGYSMLFWVDGTTCFVAGIFLIVMSRNWHRRVKKEESSSPTIQVNDVPPWKNKQFMLFLLATFLMGFCFMQWFHTIPVFIKTEWGFDEGYIGLLLAVSSFYIALVEMPLIHFIERSGKITKALIIGLVIIGSSYLVFLLPASYGLGFLAIFLWTTGEILHLPLNSSRAIELSPDSRRGTYMSYFWMAWSMTLILCPIVGLNFADKFGFSSLWILLFVVMVFSLIFNVISQRSTSLTGSN